MGMSVVRKTWLLLSVLVLLLSVQDDRCEARSLPTFLYPGTQKQNSQSHSADAKEAMTLLSLLARLQQKRRRLEDVTGGSDNDVSSGVQLTKRQRQCYWSVVTCY